MTAANAPSSTRDRNPWLFLAAQLVVAAGIACFGLFTAARFRTPWTPPPLRQTPLSIAPRYDDPDVVSEKQLRHFLLRLRPRLEGKNTLIPNVDHALRLWGPGAEFGDPQFASGRRLLGLLTDDRCFAELYGPDCPPLLINRGPGVVFRLKEGRSSCSHPDHTAACMAGAGLPLSLPIVTRQGERSFLAVVEQSLRDFQFNQAEYEWSSTLFALFLPPATDWTTTQTEHVSFDRLAQRTMRERFPRGVCYAQHRLYNLALFLRLDEEVPILSDRTRERICAFLGDATARLAAHQHPDGFWNSQWAHQVPENREPTEAVGDDLDTRILITGHAIEFWAIAPETIQPPRKVVISAAQWLVRTLDSMSDEQVQQAYAFLSHAGNALALWRSRKPFEVLRDGTDDRGN